MLPSSLQSGSSEHTAPKKVSGEVTAYIKTIACAILVLAGAFFVGSFLSKLFLMQAAPDGASLLPLTVSTVLFLVFLFLLVFLVDTHLWLVYLTAAVSAALIILPLQSAGASETLIIGGVMLILFIWSVWNGKREASASIKIRFVKTFRAIMSGSMWGIVLLASFLVYQSSLERPADAYNILFPKSVFDSVIPVAESFLKPVLGDVDFSLTLQEIAGKGIDSTVQTALGVGVQRSLTPELRDVLVQKYITQAQETFQKTLGISVAPNQKISDALYQGLLAQFNALAPQTQRGIVAFFTILFLLGLRVVAWLLGIVMIPIAFIFYEVAILTGFANRSFTQEPKEHIGIQ